MYYLKSKNLDVDFFIEETGTAIQVAYSVTNISDDRETKSLVEAAKTLKEAKEFINNLFDKDEYVIAVANDYYLEGNFNYLQN